MRSDSSVGTPSQANDHLPAVPGYEVVGAVAEGSMGTIFEAHEVASGQRVALKVLRRVAAEDRVSVERFAREYETASSLVHPHIVRVFASGETLDGSHFIAMEYVEGEELGALLKRGPVDRGTVVRIVCQLAKALHYAHEEGVIHRDLKPANIVLSESDTGVHVRVVDFGSVKLQVEAGPKLTAIGTTLGSPYYMSPEQAMGQLDVDPRSDVFALAAIVHELCTGQIAFGGDSTAEILRRVTTDEPPPVSTLCSQYPWEFDDVVRTGLQKEKTDRFGSAQEFARGLLQSLGLEPNLDRFADAHAAEIERALSAVAVTDSDRRGSATPEEIAPAGPTEPPLPMRKTSIAVKVAVGVVVAAAVLLVAWAIRS